MTIQHSQNGATLSPRELEPSAPRHAETTEAILDQISGGVWQYHADHGSYPPSSDSGQGEWTGDELLYLHLVGYGPDLNEDSVAGGGQMPDAQTFASDDGYHGYGFRLVPSGVIYGPYNGTENLRRAVETGESDQWCFADGFGNPIRYQQDGATFTLRSAGPDGQYGNSDDICYPSD